MRKCQRKVPRVKRKYAPVSLGPYSSKTDCFFCGQAVVKGIHGYDESAIVCFFSSVQNLPPFYGPISFKALLLN